MSAKIPSALLAAALVLTFSIGGTTAAQALETCPAPSTPAPVVTPKPEPTKPPAAISGPLTNRTNVQFSGAGLSSYAHVYAGHIDPTKPIKLQFHLHGDGAYEPRNPGYSINTAYRKTAEATNAVFVVPHTPIGNTWWRDARASDWLAEVTKQLTAQYNVDTSDVWLTGYSGGAQAISQHFIPKHHGLIRGGGVVLVGGGGVYSNNLGAAGARLGNTLSVHYVAGSNDRGAGDGFDAYRTAQQAAPKWRAAGFSKVTFFENRDNHLQIANDGPIILAQYR